MQVDFHIFLTYLTNYLDPQSTKDQILVKKALVLFRQEQVHDITFESPHLYGIVTELRIQNVMLNIYAPHKSSCSCEGKELCEHKLALFFNYFSQFYSVSIWIDEWKDSQSPNNSNSQQYKKTLAQEYENWSCFFKEKLVELFPINNVINKYNLQRFQTDFEEVIKVYEPIEYEWAILYKSIAYFTVLKHIWNFSVNDIISQINHQFFSRFKLMFQQYSQSPIFFQADSFHSALLLETRDTVFSEPAYSSTKWQVYRLLWSPRLSTVKQKVEEIKFLKENKENAFSIWAMVHLYLTNKEDFSAITILKSADTKQIEHLSVLLEEFISKKEFNRALPFIDWIIKEQIDFLKDLSLNELLIRIFSKQIRVIAQETNRIDLLEKFYKEYLSSTYKDYLTFLFNQKNYRKWIELLFISQQENLMFYFEEIKHIEVIHPELTLPFYHRQIHLLILQKDRNSYRQASRLLHHLRELYNHCNRRKDWDLYLIQLIEKHRRLRAFQDELKRWNLHVSSNE